MPPCNQSSPLLAAARSAAIAATAVVLALAPPHPVAAQQKLEVRNNSRVLLGRSQVSDTATWTAKNHSLGFTNVFREGRSLENSFAGRFAPVKATKLQLNTRTVGGDTNWEAKINQKFRAFTFDFGGGSHGLFHTGIQYGARKGKGFGFSASWVGDDRSSGANLQLWHRVESIDVAFAIQHNRRGFGWRADTGKQLASILRGVLRYETSTGADGNGASHQVIYGRDMRTGGGTLNDFDQLRLTPEEDVFSDNGVNITSPLYPEDDPLAWLVEGYGARLGDMTLDKKNLLEAEVVSYVTDSLWVGGDFLMKDGVAERIDTQFGITGGDLKLAASFGYAPQTQRFGGRVQFRWTPFQRAASAN